MKNNIKLYRISIILLLAIILMLSLKINQLSQVEVLDVIDNENGTYTLEMIQGHEHFNYHFE